MSSPEQQFSEQCSRAVAENGAIDPKRLMALVIEAYRQYQTQITLAEDSMGRMRAVNKALEASLDAAVKRSFLFELALQHAPIGISLFDENERLIGCNDQFCAQLGLPRAAATVGVRFSELRHRIQGRETPLPAEAGRRMAAADTEPGRNRSAYFEWKMNDGRIVHATITVLPDKRVIAIHRDITAERASTERVEYLAHHDALTDLPNRQEFAVQFTDILKQRKAGQKIALLLLNLDFFKTVNDTLGVSVGDHVLEQVAARLAACAGSGDVVARLGSDEFAVLQRDAAQPAGSADLAHAIGSQLAHPFAVGDKQIGLSASIGIVVAPDFGDNPELLLKNAGLALSRAKKEGRKTVRYFEPAMDARLLLQRDLEADLRKAVQNAEFELHYQPIYDLKQDRVTTLEALVRWNHPQRGRVSPLDFIPLAEEMGLIVDIGRWVLYQACLDAAQWPAGIKVSVNISAIQFKGAGLLDDVLSALAMAGLAPERLDLEVTESVLIRHRDDTLALLHDLKFHGISISMDDFGTGYSSLSYLRSFPFDKIKIDKSFVDEIAIDEQALALIRAIIFLGRTLGMAITVEGVETPAQFQLLQREACDEIQGYFVHAPQPISKASELLRFRAPAL